MSKLSKEELLKWLEEEVSRYAFLQTTHPYLAQKPIKKDEQAYQQIKEMIKKSEITEEWIEEKATKFLLSSPGTYTYQYQSQLNLVKDFIRKIVEEIK